MYGHDGAKRISSHNRVLGPRVVGDNGWIDRAHRSRARCVASSAYLAGAARSAFYLSYTGNILGTDHLNYQPGVSLRLNMDLRLEAATTTVITEDHRAKRAPLANHFHD